MKRHVPIQKRPPHLVVRLPALLTQDRFYPIRARHGLLRHRLHDLKRRFALRLCSEGDVIPRLSRFLLLPERDDIVRQIDKLIEIWERLQESPDVGVSLTREHEDSIGHGDTGDVAQPVGELAARVEGGFECSQLGGRLDDVGVDEVEGGGDEEVSHDGVPVLRSLMEKVGEALQNGMRLRLVATPALVEEGDVGPEVLHGIVDLDDEPGEDDDVGLDFDGAVWEGELCGVR